MPLAKIHILEGQYDEDRLRHLSSAVQDALISALKIPPDDFFQLIHVLPRNHFLHTPSFLGLRYSDDLIVLEIAFIAGRPKETRSRPGSRTRISWRSPGASTPVSRHSRRQSKNSRR